MRWLFQLILLSVLGGLVMVGCGGASSSVPGAGESASNSATSGDKIIPGAGLNKDVTLVANTGRPQFLDSHAVW